MEIENTKMPERLMTRARNVSTLINTRVIMTLPSILADGESFSLKISVLDETGLPPTDFPFPLRFVESPGVKGLPNSVTLPSGASSLVIPGLRAGGAPVATVRAHVLETPHQQGDPQVYSNPAWVLADPVERIFWGDLHIHSLFSNCSGWRCLEPEWAYRYARDFTHLDFAAVADHLRGIASDPQRWPTLQTLARAFNQPGRFVSFLGFESSHSQGYGGDNNVYFLEDDAPHFWLDREDMRGGSPKVHLRELWAQMDATGTPYLSIPHHTGRSGKYRSWNEPYHDPEREPLFEIYSSWGSSEALQTRLPIYGGNNEDPSYFVDALKAGAHFGVMASSDDHATLPGSIHRFRVMPFARPNLDSSAHKGLTAIRAPRLSRPDLFAAMRQRATYATTHTRALLDFRLDDAVMGERLPLDKARTGRRRLRLRMTLEAPADVAEVTLLRNGEVMESRDLKGDALHTEITTLDFEDPTPFETVALRDTRYRASPFVVYYARIRTATGDHQWTSPIWVDG